MAATVIALSTAQAVATNAIAVPIEPEKPLPGQMKRIASVPLGAEITGLTLSPQGELFFNVQHPSDALAPPFNKAVVGIMEGINLEHLTSANLPNAELTVPSGNAKYVVTTLFGDYNVLFNGGDTFDLPGFPGIGSIQDASQQITITESNDPDFNSFIPIDATSGYLFTNWEDRPGGMSRVKLVKNSLDRWTVDTSDPNHIMNIDFGQVGGTWVNCFGTTTPWQTPLSAEELYWDITANWNNPNDPYHGDVANLAEHLGVYPNPYRYGYNVEVTAPTAPIPQPVKRFAMGRFSHENAVIMPDKRTVYQSDDGTDTVFFKFVADRAGDLSAGTLYAAKVTQDLGTNPATTGFNVEWVRLGSNSDRAIAAVVASFDGIGPEQFVAGQNSYITDAEISAWAEKVKKGGKGSPLTFRERAIPFLESRKAAAALGATAEFRKMEGVNINYQSAADGSVPYMYMAMSEIGEGMADDVGDIRLDERICGVVYRMRLDTNFNVRRMEPAVTGGAYDANDPLNRCDAGAVANPDNLIVLTNGWVVIGEDTSKHENNMLWLLHR
jgi:hypothetical protein